MELLRRKNAFYFKNKKSRCFVFNTHTHTLENNKPWDRMGLLFGISSLLTSRCKFYKLDEKKKKIQLFWFFVFLLYAFKSSRCGIVFRFPIEANVGREAVKIFLVNC